MKKLIFSKILSGEGGGAGDGDAGGGGGTTSSWWTDGQTDRWKNGKTDKRTDGQKKKRQFEKCKNGMSSRFSIFISNNFNFNYFSFLNFLELIGEYLTSWRTKIWKGKKLNHERGLRKRNKSVRRVCCSKAATIKLIAFIKTALPSNNKTHWTSLWRHFSFNN